MYATISTSSLSLTLRRLARTEAGAHASCPVDVIPGDAAPEVTGRSYHWVTPGGRPVRYPSAYRRAWGKPVYVASTIGVEVGAEWLAARDPQFAAELEIGANI